MRDQSKTKCTTPRPEYENSSHKAVDLGLNFEKQWNQALKPDPTFIFVTGWNKWIAGRFQQWHLCSEKDSYFPGGLFVDQYDQEHSRNCEPMRNGHTDNYYYQLASWVRRYKGPRQLPQAHGPIRITIDGAFQDREPVTPKFRDTITASGKRLARQATK